MHTGMRRIDRPVDYREKEKHKLWELLVLELSFASITSAQSWCVNAMMASSTPSSIEHTMLAASEQLQVPSNITKVWFFFFYFKSCPIFCSSGPLVSTLLICYFIYPTNTGFFKNDFNSSYASLSMNRSYKLLHVVHTNIVGICV